MFRRAVLWSFASQIASFVIQFGSSVLIARLLSPRELGIYGVAVAVSGIIQIFAAFGVAQYIMREPELSQDTLQTAFTINAILCCLLSALIFGSSFVGGQFFADDRVARVLRWLAVAPVVAIPAFRPNVVLQRAMQFRGTSIVATASTLFTSIVSVGSAMLGASYMSPAYGALAGAGLATLGTLVIGRRHLGMRLTLKEWRPITAFGLRLMSIGGISSAAVRLSDIILGHFLGLAALGLYSRATNLSNLLFANVYGSATRVVFAKLSQAQRDGEGVTEVYLRGYRIITAVMAPLLLGLAVLSYPAVRLLYGERWLAAATPLSLILLGQMVSLTFAMNWELFVIRDELRTQTRLELLRSVIGVTTQTIGCLFSLVAVAATSIVDNLLSFAVYQRYMPGLARTSPRTLYRAYGEAALLSVVAAAPAFALMVVFGWSARTPLVLVFGSVALGGVLWLALVVRTGHPILHEINLALSKLTRSRLVLG